jgi:hypothetical protein
MTGSDPAIHILAPEIMSIIFIHSLQGPTDQPTLFYSRAALTLLPRSATDGVKLRKIPRGSGLTSTSAFTFVDPGTFILAGYLVLEHSVKELPFFGVLPVPKRRTPVFWLISRNRCLSDGDQEMEKAKALAKSLATAFDP